MYLQHFALHCKPFELMPDPRFYYPSAHHRLALSTLEYAVLTGADICLVSGEVGSGKTTLVRCLLDRMRNQTVGVVNNTHAAFGDLLDWIAVAFDLEVLGSSPAVSFRALVQFLRQQKYEGRQAVLIVDEAQNLTESDLEGLRVLNNVNASGQKLLQIMLVGQPEVREKLRRKSLRQLVQRIAVDFDLKPLTAREVTEYIGHRLVLSGGSLELFTQDALLAVCRHSKGIPRVVNHICALSLVYAFAEHATRVEEHTVEELVAERSAEGLFWFNEAHCAA